MQLKNKNKTKQKTQATTALKCPSWKGSEENGNSRLFQVIREAAISPAVAASLTPEPSAAPSPPEPRHAGFSLGSHGHSCAEPVTPAGNVSPRLRSASLGFRREKAEALITANERGVLSSVSLPSFIFSTLQMSTHFPC